MLSHTPFLCAIYVILIISTIFTIIRPNWLIAWIILEINILRFIPLIIITKSNQETEASIKYFLSQALGSIIILLGISMLNQPILQNIPTWIIITAIFIKLGMAPCHFWYPSVIASLSWINCLTLSTWQKLAPLTLLIMTTTKNQSTLILVITARIKSLIGGIIGINQTHLRPLLAYSSIGHIGWITSILAINKISFCIIYFIIYSVIVMPIFILINIINSKTIKTIYNIFKINSIAGILIAICLLSLAGIPPLSGFIPKLLVVFKLIETNYIILLFLLIGAYINLYYYLNITFNLIIRRNNISLKYERTIKYNLPFIIIISTSTIGLIPIII